MSRADRLLRILMVRYVGRDIRPPLDFIAALHECGMYTDTN